jgi:uncharacterized protein YegP (UPF0339 family)
LDKLFQRHFTQLYKWLFLPKFNQNLGTFVIKKHEQRDYKFVFASRKGKTIFTSIVCKHKSDCAQIIEALQTQLELFAFTKVKNASGKYFFRLTKDGFVLANSRKYTTELLMGKGVDEVLKGIHTAEVLDFSDNDFVFPDAADVFENTL